MERTYHPSLKAGNNWPFPLCLQVGKIDRNLFPEEEEERKTQKLLYLCLEDRFGAISSKIFQANDNIIWIKQLKILSHIKDGEIKNSKIIIFTLSVLMIKIVNFQNIGRITQHYFPYLASYLSIQDRLPTTFSFLTWLKVLQNEMPLSLGFRWNEPLTFMSSLMVFHSCFRVFVWEVCFRV